MAARPRAGTAVTQHTEQPEAPEGTRSPALPQSTAVTASMGFMVWRLQRKIQKKDEAKEKAETEKQAETDRQKRDVQQYERFMIQTQRTLTKLCVATAVAVRDGKSNGEMTTALEIMEKVAREQRDFLVDQGINGLF